MEYRVKLTEEQVQALIADYAVKKDVHLRDRIVLQYKNLVESIARRFAGSGEPLEDLVQEGYIGLITAADLYNIDKGVKFSTYATHFIIGQIKHALRDRGKIIKEPAWLQELNHRMTRVIDSLIQEMGSQPTEAQIANIMHISEEMVADLLTTREVFKVSSLDAESEDSSFGPEIENVKDEKYTVFCLPVEDKIVLETAVNKLKIIEQKVIADFYYMGLTQTEIARKLGISCNYVSHILRSGTKKLRRILTTEELMEVQMQLQLASRRAESLVAQQDSSVVDTLTGLYTRSYIESRLGEEMSRATRSKHELAFTVVTIHGLEDVGRKYGSMRQDDVLCALAHVIRDSVRRCDIVGRTGDWEFSLILPQTGSQVKDVCGRVGDAIHRIERDLASAKLPADFTVYIGSSIYPAETTHAQELMSLAQAAQTEFEKPYSRRKAA